TENFDWESQATDSLNEALKVKHIEGKAKNVILFVGDGMGISTITSARIYKGQKMGNPGEETVMEFEKFPNTALIKTYGTDRQVSDSAQTATAFLCGVKTRWGVVGLKDGVTIRDCKATGVVTTTRITHATPASAYAHAANRDWEADSNMNDVVGGCSDIAKQLVYDNRDIQVIMGGGRRNFFPSNVPDIETGEDKVNKRNDSLDLVQVWKDQMTSLNRRHSYVWKKSDFDAVNPEDTDYLLGLFSASHMSYELERDSSANGEPSLAEMTDKAIKILRKDQDGFFLLVEGGRIDHAHHDSLGKKALEDTVALETAVKKAVDLTSEEDTLIIVTADHSHPFSLTGYTGRGNNILGVVDTLSDEPTKDKLNYTALLYANGPGGNDSRVGLTNEISEGNDYRQVAAIHLDYETHSGEDVAAFARGPWAHLFRGVQEQHYIAHVMQYASCVGRYRNCNRPTSGAISQRDPISLMSFLFLVSWILLKWRV
ncbi:hypothetical protein FSP39_009854, partial [Pinctada imbricata]